MRTALIASIGLVGVAATAFAVTPYEFDDAASGARRVASGAAVRQLAWPFRGSCKSEAPGFDQRQCRVLQRRAKKQAEAATYHVEVAAPVRRKGKVLSVYGCLDCGADSGSPLTVGPGKVVREKGVVLGPVLGRVTGEVSEEVAGRIMTEILFRLDASGKPKLVGYRAYDSCTGEVIATNPPSEDRNPSKKCGKDGKPVENKPAEK